MRRMGLLLLAAALAVPAMARDEIVLRHDLSGSALDAMSTLVGRFNDEQKGKPQVQLQALSGLDDSNRRLLPHLALLDADDSAEFFGTRPRFRMLYQVMSESREKFEAARFLPLIGDAIDDSLGRLQALPMGLSLPVLMWNKDAFRNAGIDPEVAPRTWMEVQERAGALYDSGFKCPFTSSRFAWVHLENLSSQHGEALASRDKGGTTRVAVNRLVNVKHLALMASWYKSEYLHYFGAGAESDRKFIAGECAMFTGASSVYAAAARSGFAVGVTELPHHDDVRDVAPGRVLPDGAALWVLADHKKAEYQVAARFVSFLLRPQNQVEWVRASGYLPMTPAAIDGLRAAGVPPTLLDAAVRRLSERKAATHRTKHGAGMNRLRQIFNEEIADVWTKAKPAKEALDTATQRFNGESVAGPPTAAR